MSIVKSHNNTSRLAQTGIIGERVVRFDHVRCVLCEIRIVRMLISRDAVETGFLRNRCRRKSVKNQKDTTPTAAVLYKDDVLTTRTTTERIRTESDGLYSRLMGVNVIHGALTIFDHSYELDANALARTIKRGSVRVTSTFRYFKNTSLDKPFASCRYTPF